ASCVPMARKTVPTASRGLTTIPFNAHRAAIPVFVDVSGGRDQAHRRAGQVLRREWPPRAGACAIRSAWTVLDRTPSRRRAAAGLTARLSGPARQDDRDSR